MSYEVRKSGLFVPCELHSCINRLEGIAIDETRPVPSTEKEKFEVMLEFYLLACLCRITELARDMLILRDKKRFNTALTCYRPFVESIITFVEFFRKAENLQEENNDRNIALEVITRFNKTKNKLFKNRLEEDIEICPYWKALESKYNFTKQEYIDASNATNILSILEYDANSKKEYFENIFKRSLNEIKKEYDIFSEYIHSNAFSITHHYIDCVKDDSKPASISIKVSGAEQSELKKYVEAALRYIFTFEESYKNS